MVCFTWYCSTLFALCYIMFRFIYVVLYYTKDESSQSLSHSLSLSLSLSHSPSLSLSLSLSLFVCPGIFSPSYCIRLILTHRHCLLCLREHILSKRTHSIVREHILSRTDIVSCVVLLSCIPLTHIFVLWGGLPGGGLSVTRRQGTFRKRPRSGAHITVLTTCVLAVLSCVRAC